MANTRKETDLKDRLRVKIKEAASKKNIDLTDLISKVSEDDIYALIEEKRTYADVLVLLSDVKNEKNNTALLKKMNQHAIRKLLLAPIYSSSTDTETALHRVARLNRVCFLDLIRQASPRILLQALQKTHQGRSPHEIAHESSGYAFSLSEFHNYQKLLYEVINLNTSVTPEAFRNACKNILYRLSNEMSTNQYGPFNKVLANKISDALIEKYFDLLKGTHGVAINTNFAKELMQLMLLYFPQFADGYVFLGDYYAEGYHSVGANIDTAFDYYKTAYKKLSSPENKKRTESKISALLDLTEKASPGFNKIQYFLEWVKSVKALNKADAHIEQKNYQQAKFYLENAAEVGNHSASVKLAKLYYNGQLGNHFNEEGSSIPRGKNSTPKISIAIKYLHATLIGVMEQNSEMIESNLAAAKAAKSFLVEIAMAKAEFGRYSQQAADIFCQYADEDQDMEALKALAKLSYAKAQDKVDIYSSKHPGFFARFSSVYWKNYPLAYYETKAKQGDTEALSELFEYHKNNKSLLIHVINMMKILNEKPLNNPKNSFIANHITLCIQAITNDLQDEKIVLSLQKNTEFQALILSLQRKFDNGEVEENTYIEELIRTLNNVSLVKKDYPKKKCIDEFHLDSQEPSAPPYSQITEYEDNPTTFGRTPIDETAERQQLTTSSQATGIYPVLPHTTTTYSAWMQNEEPEEKNNEAQTGSAYPAQAASITPLSIFTEMNTVNRNDETAPLISSLPDIPNEEPEGEKEIENKRGGSVKKTMLGAG